MGVFVALLVTILSNSFAGELKFSPQSKAKLKSAGTNCLDLSQEGNCSDSPHGPIEEWDVSTIADMGGIFMGAKLFNKDISQWDVSNVKDMSDMFAHAARFNRNISQWDVSNVTTMSGMFKGATSFNGEISRWEVSKVTDMALMFADGNFKSNISNWDTSYVTDMGSMFSGTKAFNGDISNWNVSSVINMNSTFSNAKLFNTDISKWNVSSVINMDHMFAGAVSFRHKLCGAAWVHSKASKEDMFVGSSGSIASKVCKSTRFLPKTQKELQSNVETCLELSPNGDCSDGSHGPIGTWDVMRVTDMNAIFLGEASFNGDISKWDVSRATDMTAMFSNANSFNGDISQWEVSNVNDMSGMFLSALSFNGDISKWDVSSVTNMEFMFMSATSFTHQLNGAAWVNSKAAKTMMFEHSPGSIAKKVYTSAPAVSTSASVFLPQSLAELKSAVDECVE